MLQRINNDEAHSRFIAKWLTRFNSKQACRPAMAIINGWMSTHQKNQWYADVLSTHIDVFSYDSRGQGKSPLQGELNALQGAIDANQIIGDGFRMREKLCGSRISGNKILQGNCVGTMVVSSLFAGRLPLVDEIDGTILISPVSSFDLPFPLKLTFFLPNWFTQFAIDYIAPMFTRMAVPGENSESSRVEAIARLKNIDTKSAVKQAQQIFWKEDVSKYWKHVKVPSLILVGAEDPIVKIHHSFDAYNNLPYPIWLELKAPDHLLLEDNIDYLSTIIPKFAKDPWGVYEELKHLTPYG